MARGAKDGKGYGWKGKSAGSDHIGCLTRIRSKGGRERLFDFALDLESGRAWKRRNYKRENKLCIWTAV